MACTIAFEIQYPYEPTDATLREPGNKVRLTLPPLPSRCNAIHLTIWPLSLLRYWKEVIHIMIAAVPSMTLSEVRRGPEWGNH